MIVSSICLQYVFEHNISFIFFIAHTHTHIYRMCIFNQLGKYQVKDMNVYIEPLIDEILKLWVGITMYDISRPIGKT